MTRNSFIARGDLEPSATSTTPSRAPGARTPWATQSETTTFRASTWTSAASSRLFRLSRLLWWSGGTDAKPMGRCSCSSGESVSVMLDRNDAERRMRALRASLASRTAALGEAWLAMRCEGAAMPPFSSRCAYFPFVGQRLAPSASLRAR